MTSMGRFVYVRDDEEVLRLVRSRIEEAAVSAAASFVFLYQSGPFSIGYNQEAEPEQRGGGVGDDGDKASGKDHAADTVPDSRRGRA